MNSRNTGLAMVILALIGLSTNSLYGQSSVLVEVLPSSKLLEKKKCSGEKFVWPNSVSKSEEGFKDFLRIASMSIKEREGAFKSFSLERRATFLRFQFAMQLVRHPNLPEDQISLLANSIGKVGVDDSIAKYTEARYVKTASEVDSWTLLALDARMSTSLRNKILLIKKSELNLFQAYDKLLSLGMYERRKAVSALSVKDRADIWRAQLVYQLASATLTDDQRLFVARSIQTLPRFFTNASKLSQDERNKVSDSLEQAGQKLFSRQELYAIFMEIGIQRYVKDAAIKSAVEEGAKCRCNYYCPDPDQSCDTEYPGTCTDEKICGIWGTGSCAHPCRIGDWENQ